MGGLFTRDGAILWLGLALALLTYIVAAPNDIDVWTKREWAQFGIVGLSWLIGKLQTSPLPHSEYGDAKITPKDRE